VALDAAGVCAARRGEDRRHEADQGALLPQHEAHQSHADRAQRTAAGLSLALAFFSPGVQATSDPLDGVTAPGESAIGFAYRFSPISPYEGAKHKTDLLPYFLYDSRHFYLQADRIGLKLMDSETMRAEVFLRRRLEGFASDSFPESMVGQTQRFAGDDLGIAGRIKLGAGTAYGEIMTNVSDESDGSEVRLGYRYDAWWSETSRFRWRPYATLAWRDARLNNYYYGVPGYEPGAGVNLELGALASYRLSARWQVLGSIGLTQWASGVRNSPVVEDGPQPEAMLGLLYTFKPDQASEWDRKPLIMRLGYGQSTDCDLIPILAGCTTTNTQDETSIVQLDVGQILVRRLNGWPVDLAGFIGFVKHEERGLQEDFWQVNAYYKLYYYFGPWWRERLRTRFGMGGGISYASRIPFSEQRDQAIRGRDTSKLLLYVDPTIDINIGDVFKVPALRETYTGIGVSHRSGIFGSARLFNSVDGGSNYIYLFVETGF
jgi:MipA family protein